MEEGYVFFKFYIKKYVAFFIKMCDFFLLVPCLPGKYYSTADNACKNCPDGQYQDETGQTSCKSCPSNYKPAATQNYCIGKFVTCYWQCCYLCHSSCEHYLVYGTVKQ